MIVPFLRDYGRRINRVGEYKLRESDEESKNGRISKISAAAINAQIYRASAIGLCVRMWMVWMCPCHGDGESGSFVDRQLTDFPQRSSWINKIGRIYRGVCSISQRRISAERPGERIQ